MSRRRTIGIAATAVLRVGVGEAVEAEVLVIGEHASAFGPLLFVTAEAVALARRASMATAQNWWAAQVEIDRPREQGVIRELRRQ